MVIDYATCNILLLLNTTEWKKTHTYIQSCSVANRIGNQYNEKFQCLE